MPEKLQRQATADSFEHEVVHREREAYPRQPIMEEVRKRMTVFAECPDALHLSYRASPKGES